MIPFLIYIGFAAWAAWAIRKGKAEVFFFACAMMLWVILMQLINAYMIAGSMVLQ